MLQLNNLTVSVEDKIIIKDLNFEFESGKTYAIMGPNGSGKSTLANAMMGHPAYIIHHASDVSRQTPNNKDLIVLDGKNLTEMESNKRSDEGIFLSFQSPLTLSGVRV